jgi:hypothetical protein
MQIESNIFPSGTTSVNMRLKRPITTEYLFSSLDGPHIRKGGSRCSGIVALDQPEPRLSQTGVDTPWGDKHNEGIT